MIQVQTKLQVADNSGAKVIMCIRILGSGYRRYAGIGDIIVGVVKKALPNMGVKDDEIVRAVIVRCTKPLRREDGSYVRFDDNAAVIITPQGVPRGTRIFGPVSRELREKNYMRIISLAPEVV